MEWQPNERAGVCVLFACAVCMFHLSKMENTINEAMFIQQANKAEISGMKFI